MRLEACGFAQDDIGVITPYHKQAMLISAVFKKENITSKVGSVDQFQGLERQVILMSTVRTNYRLAQMDMKRGLGIVNCSKRLNVAISRAR